MNIVNDVDHLSKLLADRLADGGSILLPQAISEPTPLVEALTRVTGLHRPVTIYVSHGLHDTLEKLPEDSFRIVALAGVGTTQRLISSGRAEVLPMQWSHLVSQIRSGRMVFDVALLQLPPARDGWHSFGSGADLAGLVSASASTIFAEINSRMPWTHGDRGLAVDRIDVGVETDRALPELPQAQPGETEMRIGEHIANVVSDGAVLQIGIGSVPEAALTALRHHRRLGVHTGVFGDGLMKLVESGVVTNETKAIDRGQSVTGGVLGTEALYRWAHENSALSSRGLEYTHSDEQLHKLDTFTSINSAIEVDLTGQVNAEVAGSKYLGAVGGQVDFVRAGARAAAGLSIIAMGARTPRGRSKIVPQLTAGTVTTLRTDVDLVITEYGVADLRGASLSERRTRMIQVSHPEDRELLESSK